MKSRDSRKPISAFFGGLSVGVGLIFCGPTMVVAQGTIAAVVSSGPVSMASSAVVGEPYSLTREYETVQTLADGTHVTRKSAPTKSYRDSQGRTREEHYTNPSPDGTRPSTLINVMIRDPIAGTMYSLNVSAHTAIQIAPVARPLPSQPVTANMAPPTPPVKQEAPHVTLEHLGTQTIEGVLVEGTRITREIPVGAQGNDRPIKIVNENWVSRELGIDMLSKVGNPTAGDQTISVTNFDRNDPDPTLFQIPADYTIVPR